MHLAPDGLPRMMLRLGTRCRRACVPPNDHSRWTVRTLAAELGLPASTVHAMLVAARWCGRMLVHLRAGRPA